MPVRSFRAELNEAFAAIVSARADARITAAEWLKIVGEFLGAAESAVTGVAADDAGFEQLVRDAETVVQETIIPLDIPGVPPFIENFVVDPQILAMVRPALMYVRSQVLMDMLPKTPDAPGGGAFVTTTGGVTETPRFRPRDA